MGVRLPDDIVYTSIETQKMMPAGSTTSMHSDFLAGKLGVDVPTYRFMYNGLSFYPYPKKTEIS